MRTINCWLIERFAESIRNRSIAEIRWVGADQFENNYFTEMCSGSVAGSYLRLIDFVYHSTLSLREIKKKTKCGSWWETHKTNREVRHHTFNLIQNGQLLVGTEKNDRLADRSTISQIAISTDMKVC